MLTPSYLRHAPEMAEEIAEELHVELMNRIVERILHRFRRGDTYILTAQDKFQLETLQESGFLLEDLQREIARRTGRMQSEIAEAMEDAGVRTLEYDDALYRQAGYYPAPLVQSPYLMQLMERSYRATAGEWTNFTRTTANAAQQTFVRACDTAYHLSMTGAVSPTQAIREALKEVIRDGIYVQYPTGHRDTIETATARAVRTGISQASAQIQLTRMDEFGVGLVLVSSHLGARPAHQVWQGKVYDRSGKHPAYPDFIRSTGYGQVDGLCGANCRHHISPYFEGQHNPFTQYDSEENQKQYDIEQRQRTMERRIRDTKRQTMNWKTAMDKETDPAKQAEFAAEYQRKAALLKKQNAAYRDYCAATGQKTRPERLEIARWNRSQAAKAAAAVAREQVDATGSTQTEAKHPAQNKSEQAKNGVKLDFNNQTNTVPNEMPPRILEIAETSSAGLREIKAEMARQIALLTDEEKEAIKSYTGAVATQINQRIGQGMKLTPRLQQYQDLLDAALQKGTVPNDVILYRKTVLKFLKLPLPEKPSKKDLAQLIGKKRKFPIFLSTSFKQLSLPGRNTLIALHIPEGYQGALYISELAHAKYKYQDEVLLHRGLKYRIINATMDQDTYYFDLEVLK